MSLIKSIRQSLLKCSVMALSGGIVLGSSALSLAQEIERLTRPSAQVECGTQYCTYRIQNTSSDKLIEKLNLILFSGHPLTGSKEGHLQSVGPVVIQFWHTDPPTLKQMVNLVPLLDTFDEFNASALVEVRVDVYAATEQGLSDFNAALSGVLAVSGLGGQGPITGSLSGKDGTVASQMSFGALTVNAALTMVKSSGEISRIDQMHQIVPNLQSVNFSDTTAIETPFPGSASLTKEVSKGLSVRGDVTISNSDPGLVDIRNFNLSYGIDDLDDQDKVNIHPIRVLSITQGDFFLRADHPFIQTRSFTSTQTKKKSFGIGSVGRSSGSVQNKLIVVVNAKPLSLETLVSPNNEFIGINPVSQRFSSEAVTKLQSTSSTDLGSIFDSLEPYVSTASQNELVMGFRLNKEIVTQGTYDKKVMVTVQGGGINQKGLREVQNLALSGFRFDKISPSDLRNKKLTHIKIKVTLEPFSLNKSSVGPKKEFLLLFNPQTNELTKEE